jgi:flagellar biosynthetic protein FliQ
MDDIALAVEAGRKALFVAIELSAPILAVGMLVGLIVSALQAATQIQDQTLSFVPKILAMAAALLFLLPWLLQVATGYLQEALLGLRIVS